MSRRDPGRRPFRRAEGVRPRRRLFLLAVEGRRTEREYFALLNSAFSTAKLECIPGKNRSAPKAVLKRMEERLEAEGLEEGDEAWIVVDRDHWEEPHLDELHAWSQETGNRGFALSNPKFEYWLLLHFEDGAGLRGAGDCDRRLRAYVPDYRKSLASASITESGIREAIRRARSRDKPPASSWPREPGQTTVYRLVERILSPPYA